MSGYPAARRSGVASSEATVRGWARRAAAVWRAGATEVAAAPRRPGRRGGHGTDDQRADRTSWVQTGKREATAARDAGLTATCDKRTRPGERANAREYLAGRSDGTEPLPLCRASGCAARSGSTPTRSRTWYGGATGRQGDTSGRRQQRMMEARVLVHAAGMACGQHRGRGTVVARDGEHECSVNAARTRLVRPPPTPPTAGPSGQAPDHGAPPGENPLASGLGKR
jgi:hypothetical protein